jgi:hypothetical protein
MKPASKTNSTVTVKKTIVTTTIHTVNSQAENPVMKADSKPASKPKAAHTPKPPHSIGNVYVPKPPAAKKVARAPPKPKAMAAPNSGMTVTSSKTTQKTTTVKASTTRTQVWDSSMSNEAVVIQP